MFNAKTTTKKTFLNLLLTATGIVLMASCKKQNDYDFSGTVTANVRLVNASTDAGASKLYLTDVLRTQTAVSYAAASGYSQTYVGDVDAAAHSSSDAVLVTSTASLDAESNYTFFLTGTTGSYSLFAVKDDATASTSGKAKVRFVQAAAGLGLVNLAGATGDAIFTSQNYKTVSAYSEVNPGATTFSITNVGSTTALASSASTSLQAGKSYTVYTTGISGTTGATGLAVNVIANN